MGLLDWNNKEQMGLLGMSILANSGRGNAQALGAGLQQGFGAWMQLDQSRKREAQEQAEKQRLMAEQQRQQQAVEQFIGGLPPDLQRAARAVGPKAVWDYMQKQNEAFTLSPGQKRFIGTQAIAAGGAEPGKNEDGTLTDAVFQQQAALKRAGASNVNVSPNFGQPQAVIGPDGQPALAQFGKGGEVQVAPGFRPYSQAAEDKKQVKEQGSKNALEVVREAREIIPQATGSVIGAGRDVVLGAAGLSTSKTQASAKLKALQGALMMAQPRMEGPQSNLDVALYREMAGKIGDPTIPNEDKLAALDVIERLHSKYSAQKSQPAQQGTDIDAVLNKYAPR